MYCVNCGKNVPDDATFCTGCGTKLSVQQSSASTNPGPATAPPVPPVQKPAQPPAGAYTTPQNVAGRPVVAPSQPGEIMTLGQYLVVFLLMMIPIANIVLLFIWSFGDSAGPNKKNLAKAMLIMWGIGIALGVIFGGVFSSILGSLMYYTY